MSGRSAPGLREYLGYLRDSRTELGILIAGALLVLVLADPLLMTALQALAPALHERALALDPALRRWMVGLPPALVLLLGVPWLRWRRLQYDNWAGTGFICSTPQHPVESTIVERECAELFTAVQKMRAQIPRIPVDFTREQCAALHRWDGRFDPQRWFEAFDRVRIRPGWRLDFVYYHWGNGGAPLLYLRKASAARFDTREQLLHARGNRAGAGWLQQICFEPSALGFFQFAIFLREAPRFYLHWHSQADDLENVYTRARLAKILDGIPNGRCSLGGRRPCPAGSPRRSVSDCSRWNWGRDWCCAASPPN